MQLIIQYLLQLFYKIECKEENMSSYELQHIEHVVSKAIKKDIEPAYNHTKNHITTKGEILKLDADCEYCKIYFDVERILETKTV